MLEYVHDVCGLVLALRNNKNVIHLGSSSKAELFGQRTNWKRALNLVCTLLILSLDLLAPIVGLLLLELPQQITPELLRFRRVHNVDKTI